jgi:hypothetical protein
MMMSMGGLYGPYPMNREASGTSWQPDSSPLGGLQAMWGEWMGMVSGYADLIYDHQGGPRGDSRDFSQSMLMLMARRELADGAFGLHLMLSGDPLMGPRGYPLIFQTGETADGRTPLIDRQHPHNLLMEAAATYSRDLSTDSALFVYAGIAGEPALGPTAFMMRLSAIDNPEAPLSHHWLDSTHISYGVVTGGYTFGQFKLETSAFNGHEPDQHRYDVEVRGLDSYSARLSYNPSSDWALQVSSGHLASPEQLQPGINVRRTTASVSYNAPVARAWQTTFAFGHNNPTSGPANSAWLLESDLNLSASHTVFGRIERVEKDELFLPGTPLYDDNFTINKCSLGYVYDFLPSGSMKLGIGGLVSAYSFPSTLNFAYGYRPTSFMVFVRARL